MAEFEAGAALEDEILALEETLGGAGQMVSAFDGELRRMQASLGETNASVSGLSSSISRGLRTAFDGLVFDGLKLSDALRTVAASVVNATYSAAMRPVTNHFGSLVAGGLAGLFGGAFAKGAAFDAGKVTAFAQGGVVTGPTMFPMAGNRAGLMGEAGPEAIMPLTRGADGSLGVRASAGGRPMNVTVNISTPDIEGFRRSQSQIASQMGRALARGQRNA
jgi:phage-related minor tail protein